MIAKKLFSGSLTTSLVEIFLIVIGVLIALSVDEYRHDVEEKNALRLHLTNLVIEIDNNRASLYNIREHAIQEIMADLSGVIQILDQPNPEVDAPEQFIQMLMRSSETFSPWFSRNAFDSLKSSDEFHSKYIQDIATEISSTFEAPKVLFERRFDDKSPYTDIVNALVPARYQAEFNSMRGYTGDKFLAPLVNDEQPLDATIAAIVENKKRIVQMARQKSAVESAKWYAIGR